MQTVSVQALSKSYGSTPALRDVSFEVRSGRGLRTARTERRRQDHDHSRSSRAFAQRDRADVDVLGLRPSRPGHESTAAREAGSGSCSRNSPSSRSCRCARRSHATPAITRLRGPLGEVIQLVRPHRRKPTTKVKTFQAASSGDSTVGLGIVGRPALLFLDEPTTGLDPRGGATSWELVRKLSAAGTTQ